jgi:hypothetical protein
VSHHYKTIFLLTLSAFYIDSTHSYELYDVNKPGREGRSFENGDVYTSLNVGYRKDKLKTRQMALGDLTQLNTHADMINTKLRAYIDITDGEMKNAFIDIHGAYGYITKERKFFSGTTRNGISFNSTGNKEGGSFDSLKHGTWNFEGKFGFDIAKILLKEDISWGLKPYVSYQFHNLNFGKFRVRGGNSKTNSLVENKAQYTSPMLGMIFETKFQNHTINLQAAAHIFAKYKGSTSYSQLEGNPNLRTKVAQRRRAAGYQFGASYRYDFHKNWAFSLEADRQSMNTKKKNRRIYERTVRIQQAKWSSTNLMLGINYIL